MWVYFPLHQDLIPLIVLAGVGGGGLVDFEVMGEGRSELGDGGGCGGHSPS